MDDLTAYIKTSPLSTDDITFASITKRKDPTHRIGHKS